LDNSFVIYHNKRCSKSRKALEIIHDKNITPQVVEYMHQPLDEKKLKELIKMLGIAPEDIVRKKEQLYKEHFKGHKLTSANWLKILSKHPELMERPIIVKNKKAIIGRDTDKLIDFLNE
jgi:arsenate reductase (glutaredoxin)